MLGTSTVPALNFSLATATQIGFLLMAGVYAIFTAILYYHWNAYADNRAVTRLTFLLYFLLTLPFLGVIGITALTI